MSFRAQGRDRPRVSQQRRVQHRSSEELWGGEKSGSLVPCHLPRTQSLPLSSQSSAPSNTAFT